jgi:hypothetical protein
VKEGNVKTENIEATYRRVVTAELQGKSVIQSDELLQNYNFETVPGYIHRLVWANSSIPDLTQQQKMDRYPASVVPGPGGTSLPIVTFPPSSFFEDRSFDGKAAHKEALSRDITKPELKAAWERVEHDHWDVIQDEATEQQSKSNAPMFGETFPTY